MSKFKFPLDTILKVNQLRKKQIELEYAQAQKHLDEQLGMLSNMLKEMDWLNNDMAQMVAEGISIHEIRLYTTYTQTLQDYINHQELVVEQARERVEGIKARLVKLIKETNVLSEVKERQYIAYLMELERKHQKTIDEFTSFKIYQQGGFIHG